MASILKATSTMGAMALKPSSSAVKHMRGKLESLNKESIKKGADEAPLRAEKSKIDKGKEVA